MQKPGKLTDQEEPETVDAGNHLEYSYKIYICIFFHKIVKFVENKEVIFLLLRSVLS
jgi:hypothetical protein